MGHDFHIKKVKIPTFSSFSSSFFNNNFEDKSCNEESKVSPAIKIKSTCFSMAKSTKLEKIVFTDFKEILLFIPLLENTFPK